MDTSKVQTISFKILDTANGKIRVAGEFHEAPPCTLQESVNLYYILFNRHLGPFGIAHDLKPADTTDISAEGPIVAFAGRSTEGGTQGKFDLRLFLNIVPRIVILNMLDFATSRSSCLSILHF